MGEGGACDEGYIRLGNETYLTLTIFDSCEADRVAFSCPRSCLAITISSHLHRTDTNLCRSARTSNSAFSDLDPYVIGFQVSSFLLSVSPKPMKWDVAC
jgi:hypothetical protein